MTEIRCRELVGAYAVGALEPPEAAILADHLLTCTRCRHVLAEAEETAALLASVPPEMFIDEPADPNDLILRRTLQAIRVEAGAHGLPSQQGSRGQQGFPGRSGQSARSHRRRSQAISVTEQSRRYKLVGAAAAAVLVLGGGVLLGTKLAAPDATPTTPVARTSSSAPPRPGTSNQLRYEGANSATNASAEISVSDNGDGTVSLSGTVSGLPVGQRCKLAVRSSIGVETPAGEGFVVSQNLNQAFSASVEIDVNKLVAVEVLDGDGQMLVTTYRA